MAVNIIENEMTRQCCILMEIQDTTYEVRPYKPNLNLIKSPGLSTNLEEIQRGEEHNRGIHIVTISKIHILGL